MPRIDGERLLADLRRIADFGRYQTGVHRPHLSPQDIESRHWLANRMKEAGLDAAIDSVGNVRGITAQASRAVVIGSHTDSVPKGGWLDGAKVYAGVFNGNRFFNDILNGGLIDDGQHLLGGGLGRWQEPSAQTGHRNHHLGAVRGHSTDFIARLVWSG